MQIVLTIVSVIVIIIAFLYMRKAAASGVAEDSKTVGFVDAVGWGIMSLGVIMLLMPWAAGALEKMTWVKGDQFGILMSGSYVIGFLVFISGLALARTSGQEDGD